MIKNPNEYINDSQRERAVQLFGVLSSRLLRKPLEKIVKEPRSSRCLAPLRNLPKLKEVDYKDYSQRKEQLIQKGQKLFVKMSKKWNEFSKIPEFNAAKFRVHFPEGRAWSFGKTILRFSEPIFHGIEYSILGWVFMTIVEYQGKKVLHSSDVNGPVIEDYCEMIIQEKPDILILDGPMTYLLGYLITRINLNRSIKNAKRIVENVPVELILFNHHLLREPRFRERTLPVWETNKSVQTAADYYGFTPCVL